MTLKERLQAKFINVDEIADILEIGSRTRKNVFMYGRGGHAKSEIAKEFLDYVDPNGTESFVQACGEGLTEEKLFGGMDIKKFQKTGEIEYLTENSFMNYKYVIFEELLDSRMSVLLSLKDILTSGYFRQGKQTFKIKTEFIVCLTNRTKQEVAEDNSVKALMERFPLEIKVEWPSYQMADYQRMFSKLFANSYDKVAEFCHDANESGDFISPRTAVHMVHVYKSTNDLRSLRHFGVSSEILDKISKREKINSSKVYIKGRREYYKAVVSGLSTSDIESCKRTLKLYKELHAEISAESYPDEVFPEFVSLRDTINASISDTERYILNLI